MEGGSGLKKRNRIIITVISIVAVTILISFVKPANLSMRLTSCWNTILLAAIISVMIFCPIVSKERDIFSPFVMASVLLFALFIYAPLTCIISNDLSAVGSMDVFDGCVKATWIYIVSYLFFAWGYATKKRFVFKIKAYRKNNKKDYYDSVDNKETELKDESHVKVKTALIIWSCSLVLSTIYDLSRGISITYLLSYGMLGASGSGTNMNSSLAILGNFSYALIACWLYLLVYSHNIFLKIIVGVMTGSIYFTRGFRFIMMIMILAPIILLYLRKNKRPKMINTILAIILLIIFAGLIEVSRGAIRAGNGGLNMSYSPIELINRVFMSDFTIFKQFYAMVVHIPKDLNYKYGQEMFLYTLIMMIPRGIWHGKPDFPYKEVLKASLSKQAVSAGQAWPIIGAFYFEFGVIGCIIFMYIMGYVFSRIYDKLKYYEEVKMSFVIGYSIFLPTIMQIVCRGCIPLQTYLILFSFFPIIVIEKMKIRI